MCGAHAHSNYHNCAHNTRGLAAAAAPTTLRVALQHARTCGYMRGSACAWHLLFIRTARARVGGRTDNINRPQSTDRPLVVAHRYFICIQNRQAYKHCTNLDGHRNCNFFICSNPHNLVNNFQRVNAPVLRRCGAEQSRAELIQSNQLPAWPRQAARCCTSLGPRTFLTRTWRSLSAGVRASV